MAHSSKNDDDSAALHKRAVKYHCPSWGVLAAPNFRALRVAYSIALPSFWLQVCVRCQPAFASVVDSFLRFAAAAALPSRRFLVTFFDFMDQQR